MTTRRRREKCLRDRSEKGSSRRLRAIKCETGPPGAAGNAVDLYRLNRLQKEIVGLIRSRNRSVKKEIPVTGGQAMSTVRVVLANCLLRLILLCGLCSFAADAWAKDIIYGGNFCTPVRDSLNSIEHGPQFGVQNVSFQTATVQCPFVLDFAGNVTVNEVDVTVYDRNPFTDVSCTLRGIAIDGTEIWSDTRSSSGSGQAAQFIVFQPNQLTLGTLNMTCDIPGTAPPFFSFGYSHLTTYRLITTP
jgi:hypothetical protein